MLLAQSDALSVEGRVQRRIVQHLLLCPAQSGNQQQVVGQRMPHRQ